MSIVKSFSFPMGGIRGDMFYIKHGSLNFTVIDCYLKDGDDPNSRKDEIIREITKESLGRICRFISTHPDIDHILGIEELHKAWKILNFYAVENDIPADSSKESLSCYIQLKKERNTPIKAGMKRKWLNLRDSDNGPSGLEFLWPNTSNEKFKAELKKVAMGGSPNNISCVLQYWVHNGAKYMWMGDMETEMQQEFYDCCKNEISHVDILFHPHHGRGSGSIPTELLNALSPQIIVIGNAPSEHLNYGNTNLTITQNRASDIKFINERHITHIFTRNEVNNLPSCLYKSRNVNDFHYDDYAIWNYCGSLDV